MIYVFDLSPEQLSRLEKYAEEQSSLRVILYANLYSDNILRMRPADLCWLLYKLEMGGIDMFDLSSVFLYTAKLQDRDFHDHYKHTRRFLYSLDNHNCPTKGD